MIGLEPRPIFYFTSDWPRTTSHFLLLLLASDTCCFLLSFNYLPLYKVTQLVFNHPYVINFTPTINCSASSYHKFSSSLCLSTIFAFFNYLLTFNHLLHCTLFNYHPTSFPAFYSTNLPPFTCCFLFSLSDLGLQPHSAFYFQ